MASLGDLPLAHPLHVQLKNIQTDTRIPIWTIEHGKPKKLSGSITIQPSQHMLVAGQHSLTYQQIDNIGLCIDTLAKAPTTYSSITQNTLFRQFYRVASHPILYASGAHGQESMTCVRCGIILPQRFMQMDHQRPQAGGHHEAIAKALRIFRLTRAGPKGEKCSQLLQKMSEVMAHRQGPGAGLTLLFNSGQTVMRAVTPQVMRGGNVGGGNVGERYSLNDAGMMLYSLVVYLGPVERLERQSLHTLINLRPLCGPCNGERGNRVLKF